LPCYAPDVEGGKKREPARKRKKKTLQYLLSVGMGNPGFLPAKSESRENRLFQHPRKEDLNFFTVYKRVKKKKQGARASTPFSFPQPCKSRRPIIFSMW